MAGVSLVFAPFANVAGLLGVLFNLAAGNVVPFLARFDWNVFLKAIADFKVATRRCVGVR